MEQRLRSIVRLMRFDEELLGAAGLLEERGVLLGADGIANDLQCSSASSQNVGRALASCWF